MWMFILPLIAVVLLMMPLIPVYRKKVMGKKAKHAIIFNLCAFFGVCVLSVVLPIGGMAFAEEAAGAATASGAGLGYLAAALSTGLSALGAGIAVAAAAPAAIGATSEDPKSFGKSLIFVALGEGVALYGLLISILILGNL